MIRSTSASIEAEDLTPQAIFARPIFFFTLTHKEGHDDLDRFEGADFSLNNETLFWLRRYRGHPERTVTLYLDHTVVQQQVRTIAEHIIDGFHLPVRAVLWRRGQDYRYGFLAKET